MRTILLIMIGLSAFLSADFTKIGDVVTDNITGLEWQDNSDSNGTQRTWQEAINYCEALTLDAHDDWRLPNINELKTLIDRSKIEPAIKENVFEYIGTNWLYYSYWSSTSIVDNAYMAWVVSFDDGTVYENIKYMSNYVCCVR